ncbi:MAG: metal ABC transporter permease, partial [Alcanivorax sp.]|nr:metal ABC transporter permease [Alcanivorax sp.]
MIELLLPPLFAGLAVALVSGPMGAFVVWRRMAFFGDTLAHGALLGAALGLALDISLYLAVVAVCLGLAAALTALQHQQQLASDTLLGIVAHTTLALGVIAIS